MGILKITDALLLPHLNVHTQEELMRTICELASQEGLVDSTFFNNLLVREKEFPTGLNTPVPIAIPHVGAGCLQSFMALATLDEGIAFEDMEGSDATLCARIIFLFGIVQPEEQVKVLRQISTLFQNQFALEALLAASDRQTLGQLLEEHMNGMITIQHENSTK